MEKGRMFFALQVIVIALLISAFQVLFEYVESAFGIFASVEVLHGLWPLFTYFIILLVNVSLASLILGLFYGLLLGRPLDVTLRRYTVMTYVVVSALASIVTNAIDIIRAGDNLFSFLFFEIFVLSIIIYAVVSVVMTLCIDLVPRVLLRKKERSYVVDLPVPSAPEHSVERPVAFTIQKTAKRTHVARSRKKTAKKKTATKKAAKKKTVKKRSIKKKTAGKAAVKKAAKKAARSKSTKKKTGTKKKAARSRPRARR